MQWESVSSSSEPEGSHASSQLTCQLCSEPYKEPRILPCLHSFCEQCLRTEIERSGTKQSIECPTCQRSVIIPEGGVNAIHQNFHLGFEVEVARYMSKISSAGDKSCDVCIDGDKGPAVVFCCTCHKLLCSFCHEYHKRSKVQHSHQIVGLEDESLKLLLPKMKPTNYQCSKAQHKKESLRFYCETCQCLVCRDCTISRHINHTIVKMSEIARINRYRMRKALVCAQEVTSKLTSAVDANDKMAEELDASRDKAIQHINQAFEQLHQTIEERKKALLSEIATISVPKTTALTLQKEELMHVQDEICRYTEMTSHILQTYTDHEVAAFRDLLPNELNAIMKKVENMSLTPNYSGDIHVYLDSGPLIKELSVFGDVMDSAPSPSQSTWSSKSVARVNRVYRIEVETKTSRGKRYDHGGLQVKGELRSKSHDGAVVRGETEDHGDGTYTITLTPQKDGPHQLVITVDGEHIQRSPFDLDVQSYIICCNPQKFINLTLLSFATDDSGDMYATCWSDSSIHVFDKAGHQKRTIGSKGSGDGQFNKPYGIFIKGEVMFVADYDNHCIQKWATKGKYLLKFGQQGSSQGQFNHPMSVIVDQKDRIIVSDTYNDRVVIMDQAGTWLLTINGKVPGDPAFQRPYGLALDPQGNIHVAARDSNTVKVFTSEGTYVRSYGDVKGPAEIAIDEEGYSLVCGTNDNSLSIFDTKGCKIHTIRNLNKPRGVILDRKSSSLYVANCGANTVLKYVML